MDNDILITLSAIITAAASIINLVIGKSEWRQNFLKDAQTISKVKEALGENDAVTTKIIKLLRDDLESQAENEYKKNSPKSILQFLFFVSSSIFMFGILLLSTPETLTILLNYARDIFGHISFTVGLIGLCTTLIVGYILAGKRTWKVIFRPIVSIITRKRNKKQQSKDLKQK